MSIKTKPILDYVAGDGAATKVSNGITKGLSGITRISENDLTRPRPSLAKRVKDSVKPGGLLNRYGGKAIDIMTRPLSKTVKVYDSGFKNSKPVDLKKEKAKRDQAAKNLERYKNRSGWDYVAN